MILLKCYIRHIPFPHLLHLNGLSRDGCLDGGIFPLALPLVDVPVLTLDVSSIIAISSPTNTYPSSFSPSLDHCCTGCISLARRNT